MQITKLPATPPPSQPCSLPRSRWAPRLPTSLVWLLVVLLGALIGPTAHAQTFTVSTFAGGPFNDGPGETAKFLNPGGVAVAADGTTYVADTGNHRIRKITSAGVVTTLAGSGTGGYADGTGTAASFKSPQGVAVDAAGNVYVADSNNHRIRKITSSGVVATLAGSGTAGFANGTGTAAKFNSPTGVAVDAAGNVYVADRDNYRIRKITSAGVVSTLAGSSFSSYADGTGTAASFAYPTGVTVDVAGNVYVADHQRIRKITSAGVVTTLAGSGTGGYADGTGTAASFNSPYGVTVDAANNVYVADSGNNRIRKITSAGVVTTFAGSGTGDLADGTGTAASFHNPYGVAVDAAGNVYVADTGNHRIRKITSAGVVTTLAGTDYSGDADGTGTAAKFSYPDGVAVDAAGNVYFADTLNNRIRKITSAGVVSTLAGSGFYSYADGTGTAASFNYPVGVAVDAAGNVYVADLGNNRIRKITSAGVVTTFAGSGASEFADGTGTAASFDSPNGVAVDAAGNVYVADSSNNRIRKITSAGVVTTLAGSGSFDFADGTGTAASFHSPKGVAVDAAGNVYVADLGNYRIRKITSAGVVTTLAGSGTPGFADGLGTAASFSYLEGIAVDAAGNVYVADRSNLIIRKITSAGVVTTLAGTGYYGYADGTDALFYIPYGLAVDVAGNFYVADSAYSSIRLITLDHTPSFTSTALSPTVTTGTSYSATLTASGSPAPTFSVQSGTLPAGLSLDSTSGVISGTPTTAGTFSATFAATNSQGTVTQTLTFTVAAPVPALPPTVTSSPGWRSAH